MSEKTASGLQTLAHTTYEVTRQLKSLDVPVDSWDMMIISILHAKMDPLTSCDWELARGNDDEPKLSVFLQFLERRAAAYANIPAPTTAAEQRQPTTYADQLRSTATQGNQMTASSSTTPNKTASGAQTENQTASGKKQHFCFDCRQLHQVYDCPIFRRKNLADRNKYVEENHLCPNCLRLGGHTLEECRYGPCRTCPGEPMHNPMLCPVKATRPKPATVANTQSRTNTDDQISE